MKYDYKFNYGTVQWIMVREAFIKKKSVTFFTLGSDPQPIFRKV